MISGRVTFKIADDVFEAGPQTAVRIAGEAYRSVHNDGDTEAELLISSPRPCRARAREATRRLAVSASASAAAIEIAENVAATSRPPHARDRVLQAARRLPPDLPPLEPQPPPDEEPEEEPLEPVLPPEEEPVPA